MDEATLTRYITDTFACIEILRAEGGLFFYYCPDGKIPEKTFPFATLMIKDEYDKVSNLDRPSVYRLNVGVSKETFLSLFGAIPKAPGESGIIEGEYDFTALDEFLPHPIYGHMAWVSVLNPGAKTLERTKELLKEAYESTVRKKAKNEI